MFALQIVKNLLILESRNLSKPNSLCFGKIFKVPVFSGQNLFGHFPCFSCAVGTLRDGLTVSLSCFLSLRIESPAEKKIIKIDTHFTFMSYHFNTWGIEPRPNVLKSQILSNGLFLS